MELPDLAKRLRQNVGIEFPENTLLEKLQSAAKEQKPLTIKLGFDPTAPDLHLGHAVVLKKLKEFQDLGHKILIIIGDFTARIGDPTGKNKARPPLSQEQVKINAQTYIQQLSKILDVSKIEIRHNAEWLEKMDLTQVIQLLSHSTLAQVMHRTDFSNRFQNNTPIALHELIYPLLQGFDSVMIDADIEMGGTDQLFNCSMGRQLQESHGKPAQVVLCMPLLKGLDGSAKMSKSENNIVGLTDHPNEMFGKLMSIPDALLIEYIHLVTSFTVEEQQALISRLASGENPMNIKKIVAMNVVAQYHSQPEAAQALVFFENQFQKKGFDEKTFVQVPLSQTTLANKEEVLLVDLCKELQKGESKSQIRRLIEAGSISINGEKVTDIQQTVDLKTTPIRIKIGKRGFFEVIGD